MYVPNLCGPGLTHIWIPPRIPFLFCTISAFFLDLSFVRSWMSCLRTHQHDTWLLMDIVARNLQPLDYYHVTSPLIKILSCESQEWRQSCSSWAQYLKDASSEIVQRQTIVNFTLAKVWVLNNIKVSRKPHSAHCPDSAGRQICFASDKKVTRREMIGEIIMVRAFL